MGKYFIGLYLGNSAVSSSFGAAGSIVAVMLWIYYSAQIFFFGAEFTRQYALLYGSLKPK
jgi:membrane protein